MKRILAASLLVASIFAGGASFAQAPGSPAPAAAPPVPGPGGPAGMRMRGPRKPAAVLTHPGPTECATLADFLAYTNLTCGESGGLPLPPASADQLEKNKELVLRFYAGDMSAIADNFIQHDPAEPSTRAAWVGFFAYRGRTHDSVYKPNVGGPTGYGLTPQDGDGKDINYLVAEGDIVVAIRFRWYPWPNGPEPVYKGTFIDVWRVKDGKLAEQWCSATPNDATADGIALAKKEGKWFKYKNMNEQ